VKRFILVIAFCSILSMGFQYNIPFSPQVVGGDQLFYQPCDNLTGWTQVSGDTSSIDIVANECLGNVLVNGEDPSIIQGPLNSTDEFCSMEIKAINGANGNMAGCIFRAPGSPGSHYDVKFNNANDNYAIENHNGGHDIQNEIKGVEKCGCTYSDIGVNDKIGITTEGEGYGTDANVNIRVSWWDFGQSGYCVDLFDNCTDCVQTLGDPDNKCDVDGVTLDDATGAGRKPSVWGTATCECTVDNMNDSGQALTLIDVAGDCGLELTSTAASDVTIDDFTCGDIP